MIKTIRILLLPFITSFALLSTTLNAHEDDFAATELNLSEGSADAYTYWTTFYCQANPCDPACASSAPNPYFGPAWYNFNYGGWGFADGDGYGPRAKPDHHRRHNGCRSGRCGGRR